MLLGPCLLASHLTHPSLQMRWTSSLVQTRCSHVTAYRLLRTSQGTQEQRLLVTSGSLLRRSVLLHLPLKQVSTHRQIKLPNRAVVTVAIWMPQLRCLSVLKQQGLTAYSTRRPSLTIPVQRLWMLNRQQTSMLMLLLLMLANRHSLCNMLLLTTSQTCQLLWCLTQWRLGQAICPQLKMPTRRHRLPFISLLPRRQFWCLRVQVSPISRHRQHLHMRRAVGWALDQGMLSQQ